MQRDGVDSLTPDPVFFKSCITCDLCQTTGFPRPWCKRLQRYVWASGCCDYWRKKGTGNVEE